MTPRDVLGRYLSQCPLIAIIRGVTPDEVESIGAAIHEAGIRIIEVPLNSPEPFASIARLAGRFGDDMLVGGGTVLRWSEVHEIKDCGGRLIVARVSPDGPAARAGLKSGDIVIGVGSDEVTTLAELYRKVWSRGAAGVEVPLKVLQGVQVRDVSLRSMDRLEYFKQKTTY